MSQRSYIYSISQRDHDVNTILVVVFTDASFGERLWQAVTFRISHAGGGFSCWISNYSKQPQTGITYHTDASENSYASRRGIGGHLGGHSHAGRRLTSNVSRPLVIRLSKGDTAIKLLYNESSGYGTRTQTHIYVSPNFIAPQMAVRFPGCEARRSCVQCPHK